MFGKVIVFELFKMIKKKVRTVSSGLGLAFGLRVGSGTTAPTITKKYRFLSHFQNFSSFSSREIEMSRAMHIIST